MLVHIADARRERAIRRSGLKAGKTGVYAVPVTGDYVKTHQWGREIKRWAGRNQIAVYFRLSGDTPVEAGRFGGAHEALTLGEAIRRYRARDQMLGFEIVLPDSVPPSRIVRIKRLARPVGWRYFPEAKGRLPYWSKGGFGDAKMRARLYD